MSGIDSAMLASMRAVVSSELLPDTCNLLTLSSVSDGQGGQVDAWGTVGTALACRLDKVNGKEMMVGDALVPFTGWMLSLPYDASISATQRVEHGAYTYNVVSVNDDASWKAVGRALLERVR